MHLANKIIIWLIFIAALPCFYYHARTMKTHAFWRSEIRSLSERLEKAEAEIKVFKFGDGDPTLPETKPSLPLQEKRLQRLQAFRGHQTWFGVESSVTPTGVAELTIPNITDTLLPIASRVYVFEAAEEGSRGKYLGYFHVESVEGENVQLKPDPLRYGDPDVAKAIKASSGSLWNLYTVMPKDESDVFNILDEREREDVLTELMHKSVLDNYLRDGEVDPKTGQVFHRMLIDYEVIFDINFTEETLLRDLLVVEMADAEVAAENQKMAENYLVIRESENQKLTESQKLRREEQESIKQVYNKLQASVAALRQRQAQYLNQMQADARKIVERENQAYSRAPRAE